MLQATPHPQGKTVASPCTAYEAYFGLWKKTRAVMRGERHVKGYDAVVDVNTFSNILIPFSNTMSQGQYNFYKAEAELPGIVSQFGKMLVGGLLRKQPILELPPSAPKEAHNWIMNEFGADDSPLTAFLDTLTWEELQTSRTWVYVDYPRVENPDAYSKKELETLFRPYPVIWEAEKVINWRVSSGALGKAMLDRVVTRELVEDFSENEFHPMWTDVVKVHELAGGRYQVRVYKKKSANLNQKLDKIPSAEDSAGFELAEIMTDFMIKGVPLEFIPAWPVNGSYDILEPIMMPLIDKEVSLYNKMSRRNHLLYGASTYTPIIMSDMSDDEFDKIVDAGLGSWIKLRAGEDARALETPTAALADMDRAIASTIEEMAKLGVRMLTPEVDQSGIALQIRNASQHAQMGSFNTRVSSVMSQVVAFMLNWRYGTEFKASDVTFSLSADFNPMPLGSDWLRLATEWYQMSLIPRSVWVQILKQNDMLPSDYDDKAGQAELTDDSLVNAERNVNTQYAQQVRAAELGLVQEETGAAAPQ